MKAIVFKKYGSPGLLKYEEVDKPLPKNNEVLIKIYKASVNSWDIDVLKGRPFMNRLLFGLLKPKIKTLGADVAGCVEAVGNKVELLKEGDEVFGDLSANGWGGFAEYVCASESALIIKPPEITFEEAASLPQAAVMALQSLQEKRKVGSGQEILMNGAGGGVGTFVLQMSKNLGAEITCVDSKDKLGMLLQMGADHVVDYTKEDFTKSGKQYDLIIDVRVPRSGIYPVGANPIRAIDCSP